jgi:AcrR family transcriptional regulator
MASGPAETAAHTPNERRRNERSRQAIMSATRALVDRDGLRDLTIEAIARHAGVGKATIYRWWPSKAAVVMEALQEEIAPQIPFPDTGSAREDLRRQLAAVIKLLSTTRTGHAYLALIAESLHDPALAEALVERYIAGRRSAASTVFQRGIDRGELRPDLDVGVAIDAIYGAVYYRLLVSHAPTGPGYADELLDQLYPALVATA